MEKQNRLKRVAVSREWLLRLLKAIDGSQTSHDIPDDARIVDVEYSATQRLIIMTIESETYSNKNSRESYQLETVAVYKE